VIVGILTDFGTRDHYVGTMKAVVLSVFPAATLVDITHDIPPQDILTGALELAAACPYFPPGTIFLVVVDPGVGTRRRGLAAQAGGYRFVGPDNGVLSVALMHLGLDSARIVELNDARFALPTISPTFEGRDRFAPAAGWLARGTDLREFGPEVHDPVHLSVPKPTRTPGGIEGQVLRVDRFGNLISNVDAPLVMSLAAPVDIVIAGRHVPRILSTYGQAPPGELCALIGSSGHLEIAINRGSAATQLDARPGTPLVIRAADGGKR
jgi:S-adenosyl-L-methionine hydrolase (adenosine-forming)